MGSHQQNLSQFSPMGSYDHHSTPGGGESSDENEPENDDDDEGDVPMEGYSVPLGDGDGDDDVANDEPDHQLDDGEGVPLVPPSFQELLANFTPNPNFTQLLSQPSQQSPQLAPTGKKSWDLIEDICLISSVMNNCTDPIVGTSQKVRVLWKKATEAFDIARRERPHEIAPRSLDMIKGRWLRVAPTALKWAGCYDQAIRRKKSGQSDENVLKEAHLIYGRKWGKFTLIEQWKILRNFRKWRVVAKSTEKNPRGRPTMDNDVTPIGSGSSGKRLRADGHENGSDTPTSDAQGGSSSRPDGVKKAKARMSGKMVADQSIRALSSFDETLRLSTEERSKRNAIQSERNAIESKKLEAELKKEARLERQLDLEEWRCYYDVYQNLAMKEHLLPFEQEMMEDCMTYLRNHKRK